MSFYLQYRRFGNRIKQQLEELKDSEKGRSSSADNATHRLSGDTTRAENDKEKSPDREDSDTDKDDIKKQDRIDPNDLPYATLAGVSIEKNHEDKPYYLVDWEGEEDPQNPMNWSTRSRIRTTAVLILIAFVVTAASSADSAVATGAAKAFGVSEVVEALGGTGMFLIGFGAGALVVAPASELVGRYPVYLITLIIFGCWLVGAALSPNIGAQIAFRFLAGFFASAPLTVSGGTISDIWTAKEKTWAFPIFSVVGFGGPVLGPVICSYMGVTGVLDFRWADWIMLITDGLVIVVVVALMRETLAPQLLKYKARQFRKITGDDRFKSASDAAPEGLGEVLKTSFSRPFILALEPIVFLFTLYLSIIYIVLFTFLDGYPYIFEMTYGINEGLTFICFCGLLVGIVAAASLIPLVVHITNKQLERDGDDGTGNKLRQETRLIFAMIGAPLIPIGMFWMGWTDYASISIWSPIMASVMIGYGIVTIFMSAYMYIIDSYEMYAASALTFVALVRYLAAGGMTVVGVPMYKNLGTHYTMTVLACIAAVVVPIPYVLYKFGPKIRSKSKYAKGN